MRFGTPSAMGNLRPVSGQTRVPSTTCMSIKTRCKASKKEESSRSSGVNAGGRDPSGMPTWTENTGPATKGTCSKEVSVCLSLVRYMFYCESFTQDFCLPSEGTRFFEEFHTRYLSACLSKAHTGHTSLSLVDTCFIAEGWSDKENHVCFHAELVFFLLCLNL